MQIEFTLDNRWHIKSQSHYNHNFYKLPFKINGFDILFEEYTDWNGFSYAVLCDENFEEKLFLNVQPIGVHETTYILDFDKISEINKFT